MSKSPINLLNKFSKFTEHWSPKVVAEMNDYQFKLAKIKNDFTWHSHKETDEVFIVIEGAMRIDFRDGWVDLCAGEMYVVPKGVEHKPYAKDECKIMFIEPRGVVNTGDAGGDLTAKDDVWI
ncbi:cupin domain-containing protein [Pseudoalteromonas sp. MMG010]|uniref:cupin domain-containing protein n=1 Tax=Pseudoalteromonas sp. MMG010 TaxID=2822685 RepID=UPI001B3A6FE1|nr:cupin domain-containing protein [Pseudoalteromonas sp. MMG010]MBQ4834663.1 cupin domain-containing protein [Pseudoalteromonas sp. MMG010]